MRDDRSRQAEALANLDQLPADHIDGASGFLLVTYTQTTYPTTAAAVYACHPCWVDAADTEGASPSFAADSAVTIFAANLGTQIPPSGTNVIGTSAGGRVTFRYDG